MTRYETPEHVAAELARFVPRRVASILDPAVGKGALLRPIAKRLLSTGCQVVCVDRDPTVLATVASDYGSRFGRRMHIVESDFLSWRHDELPRTIRNGFDCVLMNPPFAGMKSDWVPVGLKPQERNQDTLTQFAPLEAAFVVKSLSLLKDGGRLLAIVPGSVVQSHRTRWLRQRMVELGTILHVHELAPYTFPGLEARVYLLVFEKRGSNRQSVLSNHDLSSPESLRVRLGGSNGELRFDYGFHFAERLLVELQDNLGASWRALSSVASIYRGSEKSPRGGSYSVHTCDYSQGLWHASPRHRALRRTTPSAVVAKDDILVKRVGRDCPYSFGRAIGITGVPCSDCVFILRPRQARVSTRVLFALRIVFGNPQLAPLIEKGTGASYLTESSLRAVSLPIDLACLYPGLFSHYRKAVTGGRGEEMKQIEARVRRYIVRRVPLFLPAS